MMLVSVQEVQASPKHGLTLKEVAAALGSAALVAELRRIGALRPAVQGKQTLLFDAASVEVVWARLVRGEFNGQIEGWEGRL